MERIEVDIRNATPDDAKEILELIQELARYEKEESEAVLTTEDILRDGFGEQPRFKTIVATIQHEVVGIALYYERYSTWKGKTLYLEDLIVIENHRGKGIGKKLLSNLTDLSKKENFARLEWQVLEWNRPAIQFYESLGVELDKEWINCRIRFK